MRQSVCGLRIEAKSKQMPLKTSQHAVATSAQHRPTGDSDIGELVHKRR